MAADDDDRNFMLDRLLAETGNPSTDYIGQTIVAASFGENLLMLSLANGKRVMIRDELRRCCEKRYVTTDDDVAELIGQRLRHVAARPADNLPSSESELGFDGYAHELAFIEVAGDRSFITLATHNEHNGFYSNFNLVIEDLACH